jgi:hypothetical protein
MRSLSPPVTASLLSLIFGLSKLGRTIEPPPASALAACSVISEGTVETISYPEGLGDYDYNYAKSHYWSAANGDLTPACVVFPTNAEEVAAVVTVLQDYTDVNFAMKSGGHNPK